MFGVIFLYLIANFYVSFMVFASCRHTAVPKEKLINSKGKNRNKLIVVYRYVRILFSQYKSLINSVFAFISNTC